MKGIQLEYASVITVIKIFRSACYISQILMQSTSAVWVINFYPFLIVTLPFSFKMED